MTEKQKEAGRLGGLATAARHGSEYMADIGRRGAAAFWNRYYLAPVDLNGFAIVERRTGKIKSFTTYEAHR